MAYLELLLRAASAGQCHGEGDRAEDEAIGTRFGDTDGLSGFVEIGQCDGGSAIAGQVIVIHRAAPAPGDDYFLKGRGLRCRA